MLAYWTNLGLKTVESFDKHSILLLLPFFFTRIRLNLTEEKRNKISLIKYQNQYPKIWLIPEEIKFYQENDAQKGT